MKLELFIISTLCVLNQALAVEDIPLNSTICSLRETINISSGALDTMGYFHHDGLIYEPGMFAEFDYVFVNATHEIPTEPHIRGCVCELKPCIRICKVCQEDDQFANSKCVKSSTLTLPHADGGSEEIKLKGGKYAVLEGKSCRRMFKLDAIQYPEDDNWVFKNGTIDVNSKIQLDYRNSCFAQNETKEEGIYQTYAWQCAEEEEEGGDITVETLYPAGMLISVIFLLITFCVYGFVPELRNLHGKCLMSYIVALMIFFIGLIIVNWDSQLEVQTFMCAFLGYMIYLGVQLCFFWLNVMCYDIWSAFKIGMRGHGGDRKRFLMYSAYAFGVPIAFTFLVYIIDSTSFVPENFRPRIGERRCFIIGSWIVEAIYVYIPISIILIVNIVLYSVTAFTINRVQRETSIIRRGDSRRHANMDAYKDKFFLYLRLFIVMGATWIMESISFLVKTPYIFYVTDILNCLQGLLIFLFFVCKPNVKKLIVKRYRSVRGITTPAESGEGKTESSKISMNSDHIHNNATLPISEKPMMKSTGFA